MKNKENFDEQCATKTVAEKKKRHSFRPYIKNTASVSCGLYKNDEDTAPISQHELSFSFRVRLIPVIIAAALAAGFLFLAKMKKKK